MGGPRLPVFTSLGVCVCVTYQLVCDFTEMPTQRHKHDKC